MRKQKIGRIAAVVVGAGRGVRAGQSAPKQYVELDGQAVLSRTLEALLLVPGIDCVVPVIHPADRSRFADLRRRLGVRLGTPADATRLLDPVDGGRTRQESVFCGLRALRAHGPGAVLVHDAARPLIPRDVVDRVMAGLGAGARAVIPALAVSDTLKRTDGSGHISETVAREGLVLVQTPQGFVFDDILAAHERAAQSGGQSFTDDAAVVEAHGIKVGIVAGSADNLKITTHQDFARARSILRARHAGFEHRTGFGYDIHAFKAGDALRKARAGEQESPASPSAAQGAASLPPQNCVTLGGLHIAHERMLAGHSDADVVVHALCDAIYGALAAGDIGMHFPDNEARWRDVSSHVFARHAAALVAARGGVIVALDVTIICEMPKIAPHREAMRERLSQYFYVPVRRISVKATTNEGLGPVGRGEGIAAHAVASLQIPGQGELDNATAQSDVMQGGGDGC